MCKLYSVQFHGDTVYCVDYQGEPYIPVRPIVENLGVQWGAQQQKLRNDKERWRCIVIDIPSYGGIQNTLCLHLHKLHAFLATINPKKVRADLYKKILTYQNECDEALWNYWMHGHAERKVEATTPNKIQPTETSVEIKVSSTGAKSEIKINAPKENKVTLSDSAKSPTPRMVSSIPSLPEDQYPNRVKRDMKSIEQILKDLHTVRLNCSISNCPRAGDHDMNAKKRLNLQEDLYKAVDGLLYTAWNMLKAGQRVGEWV